MFETRSAIYKMMKDQASKEKRITIFPKPYRADVTPYTQNDFNIDVKDACATSLPIMAGLKISKVIFLGDVAVGKTSLVNRFCHQVFDSNYKATIGVDFEVERFDILQVPFNLQIWDTAGQERFKCIASSYYRCAHTIVIVFDLSNMITLSHCPQWLDEAMRANTGTCPHIFLVGTKRDNMLSSTFIEVEAHAVKLARKINAEFWAVSSKTGEGVLEFFTRMAALAFDSTIMRERETCNEGISLGSDLVTLNGSLKVKPANPKCNVCIN